METFAQITTSLIAVLSLVLSIYTLSITRRKASREIHSRFVERIVDKRIASYPELWNITSMAYRKTEDVKEKDFTAEWASEFLQQLWDWYYSQGKGLFMNEDSKNTFFELQLALKEFDPLKGREKVAEKANKLRKELRADLKLEKRVSETTEI
jgi:hypothetical protein